MVDEVGQGNHLKHIINPDSPLPLTLTNCSQEVANKISALINDEMHHREQLDELVLLFCMNNIGCVELDSYLKDARNFVNQSVEKLINESTDWAESSDKDRADILGELRRNSFLELKEKPSDEYLFKELLFCDAEKAIVNSKLCEAFKDQAKLYGFYVTRLKRNTNVANVLNDDYWRGEWESLANMGFALRGKDIPIEHLLANTRMKDVNEYYSKILTKKFNRKSDALNFAVSQPDVFDFISEHISLRQSFQVVNPLEVDVEQVVASYQKLSAEVQIVRDAYENGQRTAQTVTQERGDGAEDEYDERIGWIVYSGDCCNKNSGNGEEKYEKLPEKLPPFHLGCSCYIDTFWRDMSESELDDSVFTRFYGETSVDLDSVGQSAEHIVKEVGKHLIGLENVKVKVVIGIDATYSAGFNDDVVETVKDKCQKLDFEFVNFTYDE